MNGGKAGRACSTTGGGGWGRLRRLPYLPHTKHTSPHATTFLDLISIPLPPFAFLLLQAMICLEQSTCVSISIVFNAIRQKPLVEFLPAALAKGVAVIARSPLAGGFLTGKLTEEYTFEKRDHRSFNLEGTRSPIFWID